MNLILNIFKYFLKAIYTFMGVQCFKYITNDGGATNGLSQLKLQGLPNTSYIASFL